MDWDHLKVVLALDQSGTLSGAAHILGMDQTTVGRRLTSLEHQVGVQLFVRGKTGFVATEEGQLVMASARSIKTEFDRMTDSLDELEIGIKGRLRIVANDWVLKRLAQHVIPEFQQANPCVVVHLSGRLPPVPPHSDATISFWFDAPPQASDQAMPFARVPYVSYKSIDQATHSNDWVHFRDDGITGPTFSREIQRRLPADSTVKLTATDAEILRQAVAANVGQGVLPKCVGDHDARLKPVETGGISMERVLFIHLNQHSAKTNRVKALLSILCNRLPSCLDGTLLFEPEKLQSAFSSET